MSITSAATKNSPSALPPAAPQNPASAGRIVATILSAYDLPENGDKEPVSVSMMVLGTEVKTGPPCARHKDRNSFKFVNNGEKGGVGTASNELVISAPLSAIYPSTIIFRINYEDGSKDKINLYAECKLNTSLQINETQWLILNLQPESKPSSDKTSGETTDSNRAETETETEIYSPTLRLKLLLEGPYRPEISALIKAGTAWFRMMDGLSDATSNTINSLTVHLPEKVPAAKYLLLPIVPIAAASVALLPILLGVLVLGLPFFLPLIAILFAFCATIGILLGALYISTKSGRDSASLMVGPVYSTFVATPAGQRVVYETGPRPSPVSLAKTVLPQDMVGRLIMSLTIDFIGSSSYLLPGIGEVFDVAWAPTQTLLIMAMYDDVMPSLKYISFMEEVLPFTDAIPSATMGWVKAYGGTIFEEGKKRIDDLTVVVRGERDSLRYGARS